MPKSPKKTDNKIALLAGALKRKNAVTRTIAPSIRPAQKAVAQKPKAVSSSPEPEGYQQTVVRVSQTLLTHANALSMDLQAAVRKAAGDMSIKIVPNRVLLVALLRWNDVTQADRDEIVRRGSQDKDAKNQAMWLPVTSDTQKHMTKLQEQFVRRGVPIGKTGCNEPAIARQALWRWEDITPEDVQFYQSLPTD